MLFSYYGMMECSLIRWNVHLNVHLLILPGIRRVVPPSTSHFMHFSCRDFFFFFIIITYYFWQESETVPPNTSHFVHFSCRDFLILFFFFNYLLLLAGIRRVVPPSTPHLLQFEVGPDSVEGLHQPVLPDPPGTASNTRQ